jgi:ABC-2 type transport system ATP-binding protein
MDPAGRENFLALLKRVREQSSLSVLLASHTLEDVEYLCDRIVLLHNGEILAVKDLSELTEASERAYVVHVNGPAESFFQACRQEGILVKERQFNEIILSNIQDPRMIFRLACNAGIGTLGVYPWRPTLESMFVEMVKQRSARPPSES